MRERRPGMLLPTAESADPTCHRRMARVPIEHRMPSHIIRAVNGATARPFAKVHNSERLIDQWPSVDWHPCRDCRATNKHIVYSVLQSAAANHRLALLLLV